MPKGRKYFHEARNLTDKHLRIELFDVCNIDFMGPFCQLFRNIYILVVMDYVSKWIEAVVTPTDDVKVVTKNLVKKYLFQTWYT